MSTHHSANQQFDRAAANRLRVVAIGEVLWDVFPTGPRFGGAPANFACSVAKLAQGSVDSKIVSCVGDDQLGREAIESLLRHGVDANHVVVSPQVTGQVFIQLDDDGVATYQFAEDTAWDHLAWNDSLDQVARTADAVCFGSLGQRSSLSRTTIQRFVQATPATALRVFDVNLRPPYVNAAAVRESLQLANVLKLNDDELPQVAAMFELSGSTDELMRGLADRLQLAVVALTCGSKGAMILHGNELSRQAAAPTTVVDTVGAGDAFTAALALGLLNGDPLNDINRTACNVAARVCAQPGATPL